MGLFRTAAKASRVNPASDSIQPSSSSADMARMLSGRPVKEIEAIERAERHLRSTQMKAFEEERKAVNDVAERERQMLGHIAAMQTQVQESQEELEKARKTEADLHKALRLAAERLSGLSTNEGGMRAELDETRAKLADMQMEVQHLRMRLFGEKGIVLDKKGPSGPKLNNIGPQSAEAKDDEVIATLVGMGAGAMGAPVPPAANGGANPLEERQASSRHAREQVKRLLAFVKKQLSEDLQSYKGMGEAPNPELTDTIGRQRALAAKLEGALHDLMGSPMLPIKYMGGGAGGFAMRVAGASLPRTVAVNDSTVKPVLLASGPATRWVMRPYDAPAGAGDAARGANAADVDEINLDWQAGETLMMVVEAVDETGCVDDDFDAVVLLECDQPNIEGRGLVRVSRGRGFVPILTSTSGEVLVSLQDGGFTAFEQPAPIRVTFKGSTPAQISFVAEESEAIAGDGVTVTIEARDRFQNVVTSVECEVVLQASHGASWGDEPVKLEGGVAQITLVSETAAHVELRCIQVLGLPEISDHGLSHTCPINFTPGAAACVQLAVVPGDGDDTARVAGLRSKLIVEVADRYGNGVIAGTSNLAADLRIVPGKIGNASVERDGQCSIADGTGEVWVRSESAQEPTQFWLESAAAGGTVGGLQIRHSEDEPFEATWTAGPVAQFGLYLPSSEPARVGGEKMGVGVRTEDAFGNPRGGFDGRVLVIIHGKHVRFASGAGKCVLTDGIGKVELLADLAEPFQLSLQDIARHGLRTASVLRTTFRSLDGVRAIFGDVGKGAQQRVGFPFPMPLLVLDRMGNVAEDFTGDIPVRMSGAARVAGRAPEIFRVVGGRATLPVLTTIAESVTFTLSDEAIIDRAAVDASPVVQGLPMTQHINFVACDTNRLLMSITEVDESAPAFGAGAEAASTADKGGGPVTDVRPGSSFAEVTAGRDVIVSIKAIDAYNNIVPAQQCTVFLEAELKPLYDEALTNTSRQAANEPPQRYMLTLNGGEATQRVPTRVAGELRLQLKEPSLPNLDLSSRARLKVVAADAVSIDVVNMPEAGRAGVEFQFLVRALDKFGNVDERFEREVALDSDGAPLGMQLENDGRVKLVRGTGRSKCTMPQGSDSAGAAAGAIAEATTLR